MMITRTYTYELTKEGLKDFVEQKKGESDDAYKSRLKDIWAALKDHADLDCEDELDESIVEEVVEQAVDNGSKASVEIPNSAPVAEPTIREKYAKAFDLSGFEIVK